MRISDCGSDVCSSDLKWRSEGRTQEAVDLLEDHLSEVESTGYQRLNGAVHSLLAEMKLLLGDTSAARKHAEAAIDRKIAVWGQRVSVSVDLSGSRIIKR